MGQSAGAMSVDYLNFAYPQDPIAAGLIMQSGTALTPFVNLDFSQTNFSFVAKNFGCGNPKEEVECLRKVEATKLIAFLKKYSDSNTQPSVAFIPIVDNHTIFSDYTARASAKMFSRIPALIGTTSNEGSTFLLPYNQTCGPSKADAEAITLGLMLCPTIQTARDRFAANATTFRYLYAGNFSNISPQWWEGAYHQSDMPMIFGTYGIARGAGTYFQREVSEKMQDDWLAFAEDPENELPKLGWKSYQGGKGEAMLFGEDNQPVQLVTESSIEILCDGQTSGEMTHHLGDQ